MRIYNASGVVISSDILGEFTANAIFPLAGWAYRKSITLSRASGAVTNYQMKLLRQGLRRHWRGRGLRRSLRERL